MDRGLGTHGAPSEQQIDGYVNHAEQLGIADVLLDRWAIAGAPTGVADKVARVAAAAARALDIANDSPPGRVLGRPRRIATEVVPLLGELIRPQEETPCSTW